MYIYEYTGREGGDIGMFITLFPQGFIIKFSYALALQLWGLLMDFDWLVYLVEGSNVSTTNCNLQKG